MGNRNKKIVKKLEEKKRRLIKKKTFESKIYMILNRIPLFFSSIVAVFCMSMIIYMWTFQTINEIANIVDFVIALFAAIVLVFSKVTNSMDDNKRKKYILMDSMFILVMILGTAISIIIGSSLENPSMVGRTISLVCLSITVKDEVLKLVLFYNKKIKEDEEKIKSHLNKIRESSIFDSCENKKK